MSSQMVSGCGCSIIRSLYGKGETTSVWPCSKHLLVLTGAEDLEELAERLYAVLRSKPGNPRADSLEEREL